MRLNLKIAVCLVIVGIFFTTISYWSKCSEPVLRAGAASLSVLARAPAGSGGRPIRYNINGLSKDDLYSLEGEETQGGDPLSAASRLGKGADGIEEIDCLINGEYTVSCRRDEHDVFVPFSFLQKYFEVYGKLVTPASQSSISPLSFSSSSSVVTKSRFEWQHSYSKYYVPHAKYDPRDVFMNFENFNVEARDRVKCISAKDGIPVSTQWDIRGYLYPIQVAQFGLSHFSKNLTEPEPRVTLYEDGQKTNGKWVLLSKTSSGTVPKKNEEYAEASEELKNVQKDERESSAKSTFWNAFDKDANSDVLYFDTSDYPQTESVSLRVDQVLDFVLSFDLKFETNGSVTVIIEDREKKEVYRIHYVFSSAYVWGKRGDIYYGLGSLDNSRKWRRITRDLLTDLRKGLQAMTITTRGNGALRNRPKMHAKYKVISLSVSGRGALDNLTISSSAHLRHFFDAADWLVSVQDTNGGWPIPVERRFNSPGMQVLAPGWYSAMAQGQAMSVLTRAYYTTHDRKYLNAALKATKPFGIPSKDGGVLAKFLDKYVWYEEYPTTPSSFVLNGFVYALIGLYDVKAACVSAGDEATAQQVRQLFNDGLSSLKALLPLFDSGATSVYDLRHFTLGIAPNLARWDYHTTHIGQLLLLETMEDESEIFRTTATRWIEYMKGKRAPHN